MSKIKIIVEKVFAPKRIDAYLAGSLAHEFSRSQIKKALLDERIFLNGKPAKPRSLVQNNDLIEAELVVQAAYKPAPEKTALKIIFEDKDILVVDKPAGMVVHPGVGNKEGTLVNALLGRGGDLSSVGGEIRPGIVHRLDKETSGLLLVAKNNKAHVALQTQFQEHSLSKTYIALVKGKVEFDQGRIEQPIGHHPKIKFRMAVVKDDDEAKEAFTHYRVLKRFAQATLLEIKLLTGRTHQIRVHMQHLGHPVIGDSVYGSALPGMRRHALHAAKIEFAHPKTGKLINFESPLPEDFKAILEYEEHKNK